MKRLLLPLKALILIGSIALFSEVFRLVNSARVNLNNKNLCVKQHTEYYLKTWDKKNLHNENMHEAQAFIECKERKYIYK